MQKKEEEREQGKNAHLRELTNKFYSFFSFFFFFTIGLFQFLQSAAIQEMNLQPKTASWWWGKASPVEMAAGRGRVQKQPSLTWSLHVLAEGGRQFSL